MDITLEQNFLIMTTSLRRIWSYLKQTGLAKICIYILNYETRHKQGK